MLLIGCSSKSNPAPATHAIGGTVSGLLGSGLTLRSSVGPEDVSVAVDGPFTFQGKAAKGTTVDVSVAQQPTGPAQTCDVTGDGTMGDADMSVTVTCTTNSYRVIATVNGLTGSGLVLHNAVNGGTPEDLPISTTGAHPFNNQVASGASYHVTITQPSGQICNASPASGTVGSADVSVTVTCGSPAELVHISGTASGLGSIAVGLNNGVDETITVSANGGFNFPTGIVKGSPYNVTATPADAGMVCTVTNGSGQADADVTNVAVNCKYKVSGTVSGLNDLPAPPRSVTVQNGADSATLTADGPFELATTLDNGAAYSITTTPAGAVTCAVNPNPAGSVNGAPVRVGVICANNAQIAAAQVQAWTAPAAWGAVWTDNGNMVQHAYFDGNGIVEDQGIPWSFVGGGTAPTTVPFDGFSSVRYAGGPFPSQAQHYQASAPQDAALNLPGNMLVCAIVEPTFDPVHDGDELPIIAKGVADANGPNIGWALAQSHESFLFNYQVQESVVTTNTHTSLAFSPTHFAGGNSDLAGLGVPTTKSPLNASYIVVCGGRDGNTTRLALNHVYEAFGENDLTQLDGPTQTWAPGALAADASHRATIGGYDSDQASHPYPGRIYETAVWNEPASFDNIQEKFNAVQGLADVVAFYARNREGPYTSASGTYHTTGRHSPRIDATKGFLFGLQGWNRVSYWVPGDVGHAATIFAAGEDLNLWDRNAPLGGTVHVDDSTDATIPSRLPGDDAKPPQLVTLPAGASISIELDKQVENPLCQANAAQCVPVGSPELGPAHHSDLTYPIWDAVGPIQGQMWVRLPSAASGTLRVRYHQGSTDSSHDIALATLSTTDWTRVYLSGLSAADVNTRGTLFLENVGGGQIQFYAWGIQLTQIGGGGDSSYAGVDLGLYMYDYSAAIDSPGSNGAGTVTEYSRSTRDVLVLAGIDYDRLSSGFCISADAQPAAGLSWSAAMANRRTIATWRQTSGVGNVTASLYVNGTADATHPRKLCFELTDKTPASIGLVCADVPASWQAGSLHNVKGCVSSAGTVALYGDSGSPLATASGAAPVAAVLGDYGRLMVGNSLHVLDSVADPAPGSQTPWHGYVSKALLCGFGSTYNPNQLNPNACQ